MLHTVMVKQCVWDNKKMTKRVLQTIAAAFRMCSLYRKHAPKKHLREKNTFSHVDNHLVAVCGEFIDLFSRDSQGLTTT